MCGMLSVFGQTCYYNFQCLW